MAVVPLVPAGAFVFRRLVAGQTSRATRAIASSGKPWPGPRWGTVRYTAPASAETPSRPSVEARWGSRWAAMPVAATVVAVPEPKPPASAPATTTGTVVVRAAVP